MEHHTSQSISTTDDQQLPEKNLSFSRNVVHSSSQGQDQLSSSESLNNLEPEWLTGLPLLTLMIALSIVMFLVLLDGSIIGTVSILPPPGFLT